MWENKIDINQVVEIRAKTTAFFGVGAINKMADVAANLSGRGITKVIVMTGKSSHIKTGAWDVTKKALEDNGIKYLLYSKVTPNPTVDHVDEATAEAKAFSAEAVIAIGGGSPIDAAKSVAILLAYPEKNATELYELSFVPEKAAPVIAINLTHGTGTEVDRFAVVSIPSKEYKPAIAYDCIYPLFAIDDPALMTKLPAEQTIYVSVDAINHVVEASTTVVTNPLAILLAKETIRLVAKYLPIAIKEPENLTARYYLLYASLIAGTSFDNGLLHYTHALEHPLSAVRPDLAHGLGLAMLLPAVVKEIYPASGEVLAEIFEPILPDFKGTADEADKAYTGLRNWIESVGIKSHLRDEGFDDSVVDKLVNLAFETPSLDGLLAIAPVKATKESVRNIYVNSL
ncbi:iron-containing alcohol dehydrogenase [Ruminiclostridium papyrosolvens DSM 2782]|uniref:Iron-containing alcohol dehydrogenase n=1 Tax=Ruminiclostridium papyrosolvens DSM 2782 TaxID=588581 RepID=F1THZ2_9FIRM|nr:iron-containing alcohol dehydrogenase [Ruminiclostridium papyrosolvens]EGD45927.1 iron-containing alcohol dehydrogenase [Ruminiclostridium papyrosolvens DSM 2782]WES33683.1 iron-containing alcohol dehydrogenase [Ruminiclostridium papyrosolvens DSM 2782]